MKTSRLSILAELRHHLVLTSEEKRVAIFIVLAFLLGAATKCYRDAQPRPPIKIEKQHHVSQRVGAAPKRE